jgi:hypothetical protein
LTQLNTDWRRTGVSARFPNGGGIMRIAIGVRPIADTSIFGLEGLALAIRPDGSLPSHSRRRLMIASICSSQPSMKFDRVASWNFTAG